MAFGPWVSRHRSGCSIKNNPATYVAGFCGVRPLVARLKERVTSACGALPRRTLWEGGAEFAPVRIPRRAQTTSVVPSSKHPVSCSLSPLCMTTGNDDGTRRSIDCTDQESATRNTGKRKKRKTAALRAAVFLFMFCAMMRLLV